MTRPDRWFATDSETIGRRAVWIAWIVTMIGAGAVYAGKADDGRSAFIRWRPQVLDFWKGVNIWDKYYFPNPPILPITMTPLMWLPPVAGAMAWFAIKVGLATASILLCFRMVNASGKILPYWTQGAVILLSLRPIMSDLHHGNNNLLILSVVVFSLYAWRKGYDVLAGLLLALAITYKVTPALFVPYFMYKRSWRTVGATMLGIGLFLLVVPSLFIGPSFNGQCLAQWWHRILAPFVEGDVVSPQEMNQSMVGVLTRLLKARGKRQDCRPGYSGRRLRLNLMALPQPIVTKGIKILSIALLGVLAFFCRTKARSRTDARLFGEFALVVLVMLFVSERSWKHHFVTLLLPYTYLVYRATVAPATRRVRWVLATCLFLSAFLIATTSTEFGGLVAGGKGHKIAQFYGMFFWSALLLFLATAWRVRAEGRLESDPALPPAPAVPPPHLGRINSTVADPRSATLTSS